MNNAQLKTIQSNFLQELQDVYAGKKTSLRFIVHETSLSPIVKDGEVFQVLVIGGTITKTARLRKKSANFEILGTKQYHVSFKTDHDFLSFVEDKIGKDINVIALNFAYPMTPILQNRKLDGELIATTKEGRFHGLIGKKIGQEIESYIFKKRKRRVIVSLANDAICLLLSGLTKYSFDTLAAGIVGTGLNFAFFLNRNSLVNLESASFDKFTQSPEGITVNKQSLLPGRALFEKETAGAYLYKHFNVIVKKKSINFKPLTSTEELNNISLKNIPKVSGIARKLLTRSAQLVACQIAGITEFKKRNMVFNMEGSLFWKGNEYKETVEQTVKRLVPDYKITFVEIKDSGILGAAMLVS